MACAAMKILFISYYNSFDSALCRQTYQKKRVKNFEVLLWYAWMRWIEPAS